MQNHDVGNFFVRLGMRFSNKNGSKRFLLSIFV